VTTNKEHDWLTLAERVAALLLTILVLACLIVRATHAGALWRDECGAVQLARMPSWGDVARNFQHEAFPLFFYGTLRAFTGLFGTSDTVLRGFGLLVGVAFLIVAWFNVSSFTGRAPLLLLAFVGMSPCFLVWGSSVRGYGMGSVLLLLTLGLATRAVQRAGPWFLAATTASGIAAVQCLLHNVPLIGAIALSAFLVMLARRRLRSAMVVIGMTAACALSVLAYLPSYLRSDWTVLLKVTPEFLLLQERLLLALGKPDWIVPWLWLGMFIAAVIAVIPCLRAAFKSRSNVAFEVGGFLLLVVVFSAAACLAFLRLLGYTSQPWYYLAPMAAVAGSLDLLAASLATSPRFRIVRLSLAIIGASILALFNWQSLTLRQTNIDLLAGRLQKEASPNDLIVVNPFFLGVSFNWYYHGRTPWLTVPNISDHRIHRFDLVKARMVTPDPIGDVTSAVRQTLVSGGRVWLVGGALLMEADRKPISLLSPPDPEYGWSYEAYYISWSQQIWEFLREHSRDGSVVEWPPENVQTSESVPMWKAEGWRD
jgi:hypothetical protein